MANGVSRRVRRVMCRLYSRLGDTEGAAEVGADDDGDVAEGFQVEQVPIIRHDEVGPAVEGALEDAVVVGVGGDGGEMGMGADQVGGSHYGAEAWL